MKIRVSIRFRLSRNRIVRIVLYNSYEFVLYTSSYLYNFKIRTFR